MKYKIIRIKGNKDYGKEFKGDEFSPEDFVNLMQFASCIVGNSSALLKEGSIIGTPAVNIGSRQAKRLKPKNVMDVPCEADKIKRAIEFQLGNQYESDFTYFKVGTSVKIAEKLSKII